MIPASEGVDRTDSSVPRLSSSRLPSMPRPPVRMDGYMRPPPPLDARLGEHERLTSSSLRQRLRRAFRCSPEMARTSNRSRVWSTSSWCDRAAARLAQSSETMCRWQRTPERVGWIIRHLKRDRSSLLMVADLEEVVRRLTASLTETEIRAQPLQAGSLRRSGFFSGSVTTEPARASFKVTVYRPGEWFGRLTLFLDPDNMAKPALIGEASADISGTQVR